MRIGGLFMAAILATAFLQMLLPDLPHPVAFWRVLLAAAAAALVAAGVERINDRLRERRSARRRVR